MRLKRAADLFSPRMTIGIFKSRRAHLLDVFLEEPTQVVVCTPRGTKMFHPRLNCRHRKVFSEGILNAESIEMNRLL